MIGPVVLEVRNGVLVSRRYLASGAPVPSTYHNTFPDVDGLFELLAAALRQDPHRVEVRYDLTLGYPRLIAIDPDATIADDEVSYNVTELQPLATLQD